MLPSAQPPGKKPDNRAGIAIMIWLGAMITGLAIWGAWLITRAVLSD